MNAAATSHPVVYTKQQQEQQQVFRTNIQTNEHQSFVNQQRPQQTLEESSAATNINASTQNTSDYRFIKTLSSKFITMLSDELKKTESQLLIKKNVIHPLISILYVELYPYIITLIVVIILILFLSLLTFLCFILYHFKK
jgi:hypothetical protein